MITEKDIKTIRSSDGRSLIKVLVLSYSAGGKLANVVRLDGKGSGNVFVVGAKDILR